MRHAHRTVLTANDVDSALNLRNVEVFFFLKNLLLIGMYFDLKKGFV